MALSLPYWLEQSVRRVLKWLVLDKAAVHVANHGSPLPLGWPFPSAFRGLTRYGGTVTALRTEHLGPAKRRAVVEIELEGETRPLVLTVDYRVEGKAPRIHLLVDHIAASRPWLQKLAENAANDFLPDGYRLPSRFLAHGVPEILAFLDIL